MSKNAKPLPRIVFVEDEILLLGLLGEYFSKSGHFVVAGAFSNGTEAIERICAAPPDLVVLDLQLPDINGLSVVQALRDRLAIMPKIVVLSSSINPLVVKQLMRAGAKGILQKGISAAEVLSACQRIYWGGVCLQLSEGDMLDLASAPTTGSDSELTVRETEVLELVVRGRRSKEVADALNLSVRTVDKHRENIMRKLGVHDVSGLVRYGARCGLIPAGAAVDGREDKTADV